MPILPLQLLHKNTVLSNQILVAQQQLLIHRAGDVG